MSYPWSLHFHSIFSWFWASFYTFLGTWVLNISFPNHKSKGVIHTELYTIYSVCISPCSKAGCGGHKKATLHSVFHQMFAYFCSNLDPNSSFVYISNIFWINMVVIWHEREHEEEDMIALHDRGTVDALKNCGLLKFFRIYMMRQHINLLQYFLDAWDLIDLVF